MSGIEYDALRPLLAEGFDTTSAGSARCNVGYRVSLESQFATPLQPFVCRISGLPMFLEVGHDFHGR